MSVVFTDGGLEWQEIDQQQGLWSSLRRLSSPAKVRTETWERTRLHVRRAVEILKEIRADTLDYIASILQDISTWNAAVTTKVNELALNLVELYVTLLISMAPEVHNLPPEVFEQLAGILTRVRDLVENRSRLSLTQRYMRRKQFQKEIAVHRTALINVLTPCSTSIAVRRNFILESQIRLHESNSTLHHSVLHRAPVYSPDEEDARSVSSTLELEDTCSGVREERRTKRGSLARSSDGESVKYAARVFHPRGLSRSTSSPATTATLVSTPSEAESSEGHDIAEGCHAAATRLSEVPEAPSEDTIRTSRTLAAAADPSSETHVASEEASAPEVTPSPLSTKSHFPILYFPTTNEKDPSNPPAFRCEDAATLVNELPAGGVTFLVHSPNAAVAWVEAHYDDPLLAALRARNFEGPIALQLSPFESALAIFGSIADELVPQLASALAQASGFPVMVRSRIDNPIVGFTQPENSTAPGTTDLLTVSIDQPAARLRGGAGEPDDDGEDLEEQYTTPQWEGRYHNATVDLKLKMSENNTYDIKIVSYQKFKTQPVDQPDSPSVRPRPEVLSTASLEVKLRRGETKLDRSFSNIGFLVHRPRSIVKCDFLDFGYGPPDVKLKRTSQTSTAVTGGGGVSLTGVVPTFSGTASYTRTGGNTLETADEKPMPKCDMRYDLGKSWEREESDKLGKDFESYDISWRPASDRENVAHEMYVEFGLGMHLRQNELRNTEGLPPISFVLRNQIMVWVSDPNLRAKGHGILLLTSTYIPDALTTKRLTIYETITANLNRQWVHDPPVAIHDTTTLPIALSASVAALDKSQKRRTPNVFGRFLHKMSFKASSAESQDGPPALPMYETVSRGWDATNMRWKNVIWPTLDHEFRGVPDTSERAAWKLQWRTDPETTSSSPATPLVPAPPTGNIPAVIVSQPVSIPKSNAAAGLSSASSIVTDSSDNAQSSLFDPDGSLDAATVATSFDSTYLFERKK